MNSEISLAIGKPVHEFDSIKNQEVIEFRRTVQNICRNIVDKRESLPLHQKVFYAFPPELDEMTANESLNLSKLKLKIWFRLEDGVINPFVVEVNNNYLCIDLIGDVLKMVYRESNNLSEERQQEYSQQNKYNYVLKICGFEQYLLGNHPLFRYTVCVSHLSLKCPSNQKYLINPLLCLVHPVLYISGKTPEFAANP